ncbi:hypothetical protein N2152v2_010983 [Parachlorella kessleri]
MNGENPPGHGSSLDLDLLEEYYPVDNFFSSYVDELAQRASKRQAETGLLLPPDPKHVRLADGAGSPLGGGLAPALAGLNDSSLLGSGAAAAGAAGLPQPLGSGFDALPATLAMPQQDGLLPGAGVQLPSGTAQLAGSLMGVFAGSAAANPMLAQQQQQQQQHLMAAGAGCAQAMPAAVAATSAAAPDLAGLAYHPAAATLGMAGLGPAIMAATAGAGGGLGTPQPGHQILGQIPGQIPYVLPPAPSGLVPSTMPVVPVRSGGDPADSGGDYLSDDMMGGADSRAAGGGGKKSQKQQEANKVAQQRYRERKKAKFHEMESTIEALTAQLAALQALQSRNAILEGQHSDLETKLVERESEIERLKAELDRQTDEALMAARAAAAAAAEGGGGAAAPPGEAEGGSSRGGSAAGPAPGTGTAAAAAAAAPAGAQQSGGNERSSPAPGRSEDCCVPCDVLPRDLAGIDFKSGFSDQAARLGAFVEQHGLRAVDPSGQGVPRQLLAELAQLVGRACQLCQAALRVEGVRVIELIAKDPATMSLAENEEENRRWRRALEVMRLSPGQQQQLLMLRQSHLAKMQRIYEERQRLNLEAMALMLPHQSRNPYEDNTVEGRLHNISSCGYLAIARSNAELGAVLDKVKDNLRREQRAVMDINCVTTSKILSPVQSALYILEVYPLHCDALALTNVLARTVAREDLGLPPGRCPNAATCPKVASGICNGYNCTTLGLDQPSACRNGGDAAPPGTAATATATMARPAEGLWARPPRQP